MLYIISTPIGNLLDISFRAVKLLSLCDYILCEDTRKSKILLNHYEIKTPLISYHKFNEKKSLPKILQDLKNNKTIALISDAGTPLMSDPGFFLVNKCFEKNIKVEAIPGPCSVIQALILSGFETVPFQFLGFLPKNPNELNLYIKKMLFYDGTSIVFDSPNRIRKTVEKIKELDPKRELAILKELTKKFEKRIFFTSAEMHEYLQKSPLKGEVILAVRKGKIIDDIPLEQCIKMLQNLHGLTLKEAIKMAAKIKHIPKKEIYKIFKIK